MCCQVQLLPRVLTESVSQYLSRFSSEVQLQHEFCDQSARLIWYSCCVKAFKRRVSSHFYLKFWLLVFCCCFQANFFWRLKPFSLILFARIAAYFQACNSATSMGSEMQTRFWLFGRSETTAAAASRGCSALRARRHFLGGSPKWQRTGQLSAMTATIGGALIDSVLAR